eukprot:CAMPEP_0168339734 /NCGR_PEP_ID=MMETSP0213-20121227/13637_1 /TAXON_ID=151035 /ORGANISM="Euplotes harpa, Strain FSP1.4" /LENGTH=152 /DNA_ID=CAMNT_0008345821 /DNA_START=190 /DNA_END=645 /DNA_ORIENTATION=-
MKVSPLAVYLAVRPLSLIRDSIRPDVSPSTVFVVVLPLSLVVGSIRFDQSPLTVHIVVLKLSVVLPLSLVGGSIRIDVFSLAVLFVILVEPCVDVSCAPYADAEAVSGLGALLELAHVDPLHAIIIGADFLSEVLRAVSLVLVLAELLVGLA